MKGIDIIIMDMDGTAVHYDNGPWHSSWGALRNCLPEEKKILWDDAIKRHYGKKDMYKVWCEYYAELLKGISIKHAESFLFPVQYNKGFKEFFSNGFLKEKDILKGILSGGVSRVADKIKDEMGFDFALSNDLKAENGFFTGKVDVKVDLYKKEELFFDCVMEYNTHPARACYIGDSDSDRGCLGLAGIPVVINPKENLEAYAHAREIPIIHDFRQLNEILG